MDARAEGLERRILEGVLDHSRALLMTKSNFKGRDAAMSRKRVPGARSSLGPNEDLNSTSQQMKSRAAINAAVNNGRASLVPQNAASAGRRILSLSQITNNVSAGGIKRSQSVRTQGGTGLRKSSWAPGKNGTGKGYGDLDTNKENVDLVRESDEEARDDPPTFDEPEPETPTLGEDENVVIVDAADDEAHSTPTHSEDEDEESEESEDDATEIPAEMEESDGEVDETEEEVATTRRSSLGTTVITPTDVEGGYDSDDQDDQSEWVEGAPGTESVAGTDSIAGDGEVLVSST